MLTYGGILVASGSGTDADAVMKAKAKGGCLPEHVTISALVSTKEGAGCIEKAARREVPPVIINRKSMKAEEFYDRLEKIVDLFGAKFAFFLGCIVKARIIPGIDMYNIHPHDPELHGGSGLYGLEPHIHFLERSADLVSRGRKKMGRDRFYAYPTVHEIEEEYDTGHMLLRQAVLIPDKFIVDYIEGKRDTEAIAGDLQQFILRFEWRMLPLAVELAVMRIIAREGKLFEYYL